MQSYPLKFILVGDTRVGKSQLSRYYTKKTFDNDSQTTVGMEFSTKTIEFEKCSIKAQIWDTAGQERFENMTKIYFRDAVGAALVYDICRRDSFNNLKTTWLTQIREHAHADIPMILVGNKCDLVENDSSKREVSLDEAIAFAEEHKLDFVETSALSGHCVDLMFRRLVLSTAKHLPAVKVHLELAALPEGWMIYLPSDAPVASPSARRTSIRQVDISGSGSIDAQASSLEKKSDDIMAERRRSRLVSGSSTAMVTMNNLHSQGRLNSVSDEGATTLDSTSSELVLTVSDAPSSPTLRLLYMNYWTGAVQEVAPSGPADPQLLYIAGTVLRKPVDETLRPQPSDDRALTERSSSARTFPHHSTEEDKKPRRCCCTIM